MVSLRAQRRRRYRAQLPNIAATGGTGLRPPQPVRITHTVTAISRVVRCRALATVTTPGFCLKRQGEA